MRREYKVLSRLWRHFDRAPRALPLLRRPRRARRRLLRDGAPARRGRARHDAAGPDARIPTSAAASASPSSTRWPTCTPLDPAACGLADLGRPDGLRRAPARRLGQALGRSPRPDDAPADMDADPRAPRRAACPPPSRASIVHNDLKLDNCQFDPADPDRVTVHLRLGHDDARRPARRPRHPAQLLARSRRTREATQRGTRPGLARMGLPTRARDRRALRRADRRRRGGGPAGGRPSRSGRPSWSSSSSTAAGCAARAPTRAWPTSPTASPP